jgi:uncharacterized protein YoxC
MTTKTTIDEVLKDQAEKYKAMGLSEQAIDKALLLIAVEFLNLFITQQAEMKIRLDTLDQLKADLQAAKDQIEALKREYGE